MIRLRSLLVACSLVAACIAYVPHRGELEGLALRGDAIMYAAMVRGGIDVESPFRYRVIVPMLARTLPLSPAPALALISWASLIGCYALLLQIARRLHIPFVPAVLGLTVAVLAPSHLYNYGNPYITDALGLLVVAVCLFALVARRYVLFALACTLGIGVREALVFVSLGWSPSRAWLKRIVCVALAIAVYVGLRVLVGPGGSHDEGPFAIFPAHPPATLLGEVFSSWNVLWLIAPLGLASLRIDRRELLLKALPLLLGAIATSLIASDTARMFQSLFPFVALGAARFIEEGWRSARWATGLWIATCVACSCIWQPVRIAALRLDAVDFALARPWALSVVVAAGCLALWSVWRGRPGCPELAESPASVHCPP